MDGVFVPGLDGAKIWLQPVGLHCLQALDYVLVKQLIRVVSPGVVVEEEEEKTAFTVVLKEIGPNKIQVIKEIRALTELGLKEAKDLVEAAPKAVKENIPKEEAEEVKKKLEAQGGKVEIQQ